MMTQRKQNDKTFLERFWNEFFFAREFEYETPLTPDEVADVLRDRVDGSGRKAPWWDTGMTNEVEITRQGDKQQSFTIEAVGSNWGSRTITSHTEGEIQADANSGLTIISGKTMFGRSHYGPIFLIGLTWTIMLGIGLNSGEGAGNSLIWLVLFVMYFWYTYRDRNAQAKILDEAIMNAKPKTAGERLTLHDEEDAYANLFEEERKSTIIQHD
ncbi:MAG: hypothetical protein KC496_08185 [Anaerolineae bacterium]|nr:hypothetical protein [Anaerolineae bacterium]